MVSGMDVLRERIADTVRAHRPGASIDAYRCECGARWTSAHVADAVIAAIGMEEDTERRRVAKWTDGRRWDDAYEARRYVTPWERIEEGK